MDVQKAVGQIGEGDVHAFHGPDTSQQEIRRVNSTARFSQELSTCEMHVCIGHKLHAKHVRSCSFVRVQESLFFHVFKNFLVDS